MLFLNAGTLKITVNEKARIIGMYDTYNQTEYCPEGVSASLIKAVVNGNVIEPSGMEYLTGLNILKLYFNDHKGMISLEVNSRETHLVLEIKSIEGFEASTVMWGPYPSTINQVVGEIVGVVRNNSFAIGIQALNIKTLGGWPEELVEAGYDDYKPGQSLYNVTVCGFKYNDCTAVQTSWGSVLQAYCRDWSQKRVRSVCGIESVEVLPLKDSDANIEGAKIALFGCHVNRMLEVIEQIELTEGLPHPVIEGVWGKVSSKAKVSYMITDFSEQSLHDVLYYVQKAGLTYVYHPEPFHNWGHFELRQDHFPDGDAALKRCIDKAYKLGIGIGVHTLSAFTTTNDPYVTPVPDDRLLKVGTGKILASIDENASEIPVDNPEPFRHKMWLSAAKIGSELIQYDSIAESKPYIIKGCTRGAFGTKARSHEEGTNIDKLWDHPYKVFFPEIELQDEYCKRLVELFNNTGLRQISFDGLSAYTGHEQYVMNRMVDMCYNGWNNEVINDASGLLHYLWHISTRMNWGEPWGAAMREGQVEGRLLNKNFFKRNLLPGMLGWFLVRLHTKKFEATTLDDIEWALSEAAGFASGFALVIDYKVLKGHGNIENILDAVKQWEKARMACAFTERQRERLLDPKTEWHLEADGNNRWKLWPMDISRVYSCSHEELQPGQPGGADWQISNKFGNQPLKFRMRVVDQSGDGSGYIDNPSFVANGRHIIFRHRIYSGQYLVYEGNSAAFVYDEDWHLLKTIKVLSESPILSAENQVISLSCDFAGTDKPEVQVRFITYGEAEVVMV